MRAVIRQIARKGDVINAHNDVKYLVIKFNMSGIF